MIVMSTHGRTGVLHLLIGSVTEQVVRRATSPVLCIRPETKEWCLNPRPHGYASLSRKGCQTFQPSIRGWILTDASSTNWRRNTKAAFLISTWDAHVCDLPKGRAVKRTNFKQLRTGLPNRFILKLHQSHYFRIYWAHVGPFQNDENSWHQNCLALYLIC